MHKYEGEIKGKILKYGTPEAQSFVEKAQKYMAKNGYAPGDNKALNAVFNKLVKDAGYSGIAGGR